MDDTKEFRGKQPEKIFIFQAIQLKISARYRI